MIGYQAQVIPAILAGFVLVYLERFWRKHSPEAISMIIVPFLSLVPAVIIAHTVVGPIGWKIGAFISAVVYGGLTSSFGWLFATVFGFLYAPLVITGLHHMTNAIDLQLISDFSGTILWPMIALSNIAQGSAVLAMVFLQKNNEKAKQVSIPSMISAYLGVTEPAMFGVNIKYGFPFFVGMVGSACAATFSVGSGVMANSIGVGGLPGILSINTRYMLSFAVAMLIAIVVPFVITTIVGKKKLSYADIHGKEANRKESLDETAAEGFVSSMTGKIISIEDVPDKVFASKAMGDGFAVELTGKTVISPVSGEVMMAYPTKHAFGIRTHDNKEILLHIGMDTVELGGKGFESTLRAGDMITQGDPIVEVDLEYVKSQGKSLISPMILTSGDKVKLLKVNQDVKIGEKDIIEFE